MTDCTKYSWQKVMDDIQKQQTCEGDTNHIRAIPQGSAILRQKNRHTKECNKTV